MERAFLTLLNMSLTAGVLALVVMVLRLVLKKAPKWVMVLLWGFVAIRLLCPSIPESAWSLMPSEAVITEEAFRPPAGDLALPPEAAVTPSAPTAEPFPWLTVAVAVWLIGVAGMLMYTLVSYVRLRLRLREAVLLEGHVWLSDHADSPFILGLLRPRIYLPSSMVQADRAVVLAHEEAHLKRLDHLWKPLGFCLLSIHWFNPLLWLAYLLLCRDIELACDEKVVQAQTVAQKKAYSEALIRYSVSRRSVAACPIAFGETAVKERVKVVLFYKKPAFWLIMAVAVVCAAVALLFLTDPLARKPMSPMGAFAATLCNEYGHAFENATCTEKGLCRRCETEGEQLPHAFSAVSCVEGEVCVDCGAAGKAALGHEFVGATCTTPASCRRCEAKGERLPHAFAAATCEAAELCTVCGAAGATGALGHAFTEATCTTDGACARCGAIESYAHGHNYIAGFWEETCSYCGDTRHVHNMHLAKCVGYTCSTCGEYIEGIDKHRYISFGMGYTAKCIDCGHVEVTDPEGLRAFEAYRDSQGSGITDVSSIFGDSSHQTPSRDAIGWDPIQGLY